MVDETATGDRLRTLARNLTVMPALLLAWQVIFECRRTETPLLAGLRCSRCGQVVP